MAFQPSKVLRSKTTALNVAVDPTTVTKKEYEDICGVQFDDDVLTRRLKSTNYLYPKHVEVIEDIAPLADKMVDDIVSVRVCASLFRVMYWKKKSRLNRTTSFQNRFSSGDTPYSVLTCLVSTNLILTRLLTFSSFSAPRNWRECLATTRLPS